MEARIIYWVVLLLAASPVPLLLLSWYRSFSAPSRLGTRWWLLLSVATSSHIWLILGMWSPMFLGQTYSNVRFAIIDVNCVVVLGCSIGIFLSKGDNKMPLGIACILTTVLWIFVGAVNSSV